MHFKFKIWFAYSTWIHWPFFGITMNSLSASRFQWEFTIFSRNHNEFTIHYLFRKLTLNQLSFPCICYYFAIPISRISYEFAIGFTKSLSIHYLFRALFHNESIFVIANSLWFSRIHYECSICFTKSIWIHNLFREFSLNALFCRKFTIYSLFISRMHYNFTIFLSNWLWIHLNQPSLSRVPF